MHNIVTDKDGWVYVADRENHRIQVFDGNGKYETQWNNLHRPCALCACGGGKSPNFIIGELGPGMPVNRKVPNLGPRLSIVDSTGMRIAPAGCASVKAPLSTKDARESGSTVARNVAESGCWGAGALGAATPESTSIFASLA